MIESAGNEYQDKTLEGVSFTVYATQDTVEYDSNRNEYDKDAAYGSGVTIGGLSGTYDTLTAAAKAWRESKNVVTSGNNLSITNEGYCVTKTAQEPSNFVLN